MFDRCSLLVLRWLRIPPEPHAPIGDPASLRVFRAGKNFYHLKLAGWSLGQMAALVGIIFWIVVFIEVEEDVRGEKARRTAQPSPPIATLRDRAGTLTGAAEIEKSGDAPAPARVKPAGKRIRLSGWASFKSALIEVALRLPPEAFPLIWLLKISGCAIYLIQIPLTYAVMRLDYEMRWYVVTDRSLRIRTGIWNVRETTMSFANLQQVEVSQGPLQRLLGLADVKVQSAGGGDGAPGETGRRDSLHVGHFHCVENAREIRDLIQDRLRRFRESGLGDPEEAAQPAARSSDHADVIAAARELAAEARALRQALD